MNNDYLHDIYGSDAPGHLLIFERPGVTQAFQANNLEAAQQHILARGAETNIYFEWGLQPGIPAQGRGKAADVCAVGGIFLDIDHQVPEAGVHSKANLPPSIEHAKQLMMEAGLPVPTVYRHSGNGLYPEYRYTKLWVFESESERKRAQQLAKRLERRVQRVAKELHQWHVDSTADLCRLTRLPGTFNHKTNPPKPVRIIEGGSGQRFTPDAIEEMVARLESQEMRTVSRPAKRKSSKRATEEAATAPKLDSILAGCGYLRRLEAESDQMSEPDWYVGAGIFGRCENGRERFHELSSADPRYDRDECEKKLDHALEAAGPRLCATIESDLGASECANCVFRGRIASPISLGYEAPEVVELAARYIVVCDTATYFDSKTGKMWRDRSLDAKFRDQFDESPYRMLEKSKIAVKTDCADYVPGASFPLMEDSYGCLVLNQWTPSTLVPVEGDPATLLAHTTYLIPNDDQHSHILDCLAHLAQNPAAKIGHVILLISSQGVGKSSLVKLFQRVFGEGNVKTVTTDQVVSRFTADLTNAQVMVVEELSTTEKTENYNKLKPFITEEQVKVEQKHMATYDARTPRLILAFSNLSLPIRIEPTDRRFFVVKTEVKPRDPAYYQKLHEAIETEAGMFLHMLLNRELSAFNPMAAPPMTDAKEAMMEHSRSEMEQSAIDIQAEGGNILDFDVFIRDKLRDELTMKAGRRPSQAEVTRALEAIGAEKLAQIRLPRVGANYKPIIWVHRNHERWKGATHDEIRNEIYRSCGLNSPNIKSVAA